MVNGKLKVLMMPSRARGPQEHPLFDHAALHQIRAYLLADDDLAARVDIDVLLWQPVVSEFSTSEWSLTLLLTQVAKHRPDVIAFSLYTWTIEACDRMARLLKVAMPDVLLVAGGPEVATRETFVQEYGAFDVVVEGEGEIPTRRLLERLLTKERELTGIPSTSARGADGAFVHTERDYEAVAPEHLPNYFSQAPFGGPDDAPVAYYVGTRGCSRRCAYCLWAKQRMTAKSSAQVVEELGSLAARPDVKCVYITDHDLVEVMDRDPETFSEIARVLREGNNPSVIFSVSPSSANNPLFLKVLETLRVEEVYLGLQSANPSTLAAVNRGWASKHLSKLHDIPEIIRKKTRVQLVIPLPEETPQSFYESVEELLRLGFYRIQIFPLQVLRGCELHTRAEELGLKFFKRAPYFCYETPTFSNRDWLTALAVAYVLKRLDQAAGSWLMDADEAWGRLVALFQSRNSLLRHIREQVTGRASPDAVVEALVLEAGLPIESLRETTKT